MFRTFDKVLIRTPLNSLDLVDFPDTSNNQLFLEGLYLSSPDFFAEYEKLADCSEDDRLNIEATLSKYWIRSCTRCTPFATFAGISLVDIRPENTDVLICENSRHLKSARIDTLFLYELITDLISNNNLKDKLRYFSNNTIYKIGTEIRYIEYTVKDFARSYKLNSTANFDYLEAILTLAEEGAHFMDLVKYLVSNQNASISEASGFISELIDSQLLVSELEPSLTGGEQLGELIGKLSTISKDLTDRLSCINSFLKKANLELNDLRSIENKLLSLVNNKSIRKNIIQVDLHLSTKSRTINRDDINTIVKQVNDLMTFSIPVRDDDIGKFITLFKIKFDDEEVPLLKALDVEFGVGYGASISSVGGSELVNDLPSGSINRSNHWSEHNFIQEFVQKKFIQCIKENKSEITISEQDLISLSKYKENLRFSQSYFIYGSLLYGKGDSFQFNLSTIGLPSGANLISRFAHGNKEILNLVRDIVQTENGNNECIYAEIVHLPQSRVGNVSLRPVLRSFEIPVVSFSGARHDQIIPLSDIYVRVINNEVVLLSKNLNKRIIPRLTTAHNFQLNTIAIYKFLCDLQLHNLSFPKLWDWGLLSSQNHLPRVCYKNIILERASWIISLTDFENLSDSIESEVNHVNKIRADLNIPKRVLYGEKDNEILIDFDSISGVRLFIQFLKKHKTLRLSEFLFESKNCFVKDISGNSFVNEIIIPFEKLEQPSFPTFNEHSFDAKVTRKFLPSTEWLYFKIYCSGKTSENVLKTIILDFVRQGLLDRDFDKFFFIRYEDDFQHIRIRFFNPDVSRQRPLQQKFLSCFDFLIEQGTIKKITMDTYERELERYGFQIITEVETLFFFDSLSTLEFISILDGSDADLYRLIFALRSLDLLLNDFSISLENKSILLKELSNGFCHEFGFEKDSKKILDSKYRIHQGLICNYMNTMNDEQNDFMHIRDILEKRSEANFSSISDIKLASSVDHSSLLKSLMHMSMNRLFIGQQRKYELVVYYFLEKYYYSQLSIGRKRDSVN